MNAEANVLLTLDGVEFFFSLKEWVRACSSRYQVPSGSKEPSEPTPASRLAQARTTLCGFNFELDESADGPVHLHAGHRVELKGMSLFVRRLTDERTVQWPCGAEEVELPKCREHQRTRFVLFRLIWSDDENVLPLSWVDRVMVRPDIPEDRTKALIAHLLSGKRFLMFLQSLVSDREPTDDEFFGAQDEIGGVSGAKVRGGRGKLDGELELESLLRYASGSPEGVMEISRTLASYRNVANRLSLAEAENFALLVQTWETIAEGLQG